MRYGLTRARVRVCQGRAGTRHTGLSLCEDASRLLSSSDETAEMEMIWAVEREGQSIHTLRHETQWWWWLWL